MQPFSFHCHTVFSDGKNTVEEMIAGAKTVGFTHMGISDHLIAPTAKELEEKLPAYKAHVQHVRDAAQKAGFPVYVGFEVDYFGVDGWEDALRTFKTAVGADYFVTGNHFIVDDDGKPCFTFNFPWESVSVSEQNKLLSNHFRTIARAVRSGLFEFLAHPDFARWQSPCGADDFKTERMEIIDALIETGTPVEINTKGYSKIGDFFPARWMLEEIGKRGIPMLISDDAHHVDGIAAHFELAEKQLAETGNFIRIDLADRLK